MGWGFWFLFFFVLNCFRLLSYLGLNQFCFFDLIKLFFNELFSFFKGFNFFVVDKILRNLHVSSVWSKQKDYLIEILIFFLLMFSGCCILIAINFYVEAV